MSFFHSVSCPLVDPALGILAAGPVGDPELGRREGSRKGILEQFWHFSILSSQVL